MQTRGEAAFDQFQTNNLVCCSRAKTDFVWRRCSQLARLAYSAHGLAFALAALLMPCQAIAEVCDKEVPDWDPATGLVSQFDYISDVAISPAGALIVGLCLATLVLRRAGIAAFAAGVTLFLFLILFFQVTDQQGNFARSIEEGCRASPQPLFLGLGGAFAVFVWLFVALRMRNRHWQP